MVLAGWQPGALAQPRSSILAPTQSAQSKATYEKYPTTGVVLPAMGYGDAQIRELEQTINDSPADLVVVGTPIDLARIININKPSQRVRYELQEIGQPTLEDILREKFGVK